MEEGPCYADLVLPIIQGYEAGEDIQDATGPFHVLFHYKEGSKPLGEAMTDKAVLGEVARNLGYMKSLPAERPTLSG
jgi:hypothetical protein